jgi:hypothetical protein
VNEYSNSEASSGTPQVGEARSGFSHILGLKLEIAFSFSMIAFSFELSFVCFRHQASSTSAKGKKGYLL